MDYTLPTPGEIVVKTLVTHTVTYFVSGILAFYFLDYPTLISETKLGLLLRPVSDPIVMAGPLLQPIRGFLFGVVFYSLRDIFFCKKNGWLIMWAVLVSVGILGTFGPTPGSLEGVVYTVLPLSLQLTLVPEVLVQSFLLSWLVFRWVNHRQKKWLNWTMGAACVVVLLFPVLGLMAMARG